MAGLATYDTKEALFGGARAAEAFDNWVDFNTPNEALDHSPINMSGLAASLDSFVNPAPVATTPILGAYAQPAAVAKWGASFDIRVAQSNVPDTSTQPAANQPTIRDPDFTAAAPQQPAVVIAATAAAPASPGAAFGGVAVSDVSGLDRLKRYQVELDLGNAGLAEAKPTVEVADYRNLRQPKLD